MRSRHGEVSLRVEAVRGARQGAAPAARQAPRPGGRRDALPPPRARPDRERGHAPAVHRPRADRLGRTRPARRRRLHRGRDAGAAAALRRRDGAPVHHPPQRARPRPVPADRHRAVPQAADRRRPRARVRARQGLPQRGHLAQAQPRVHDGRVVRGLRRLQRRRGAHRSDRARGRRGGRIRGRARLLRAVAAHRLRRGDRAGDGHRRDGAPERRGAVAARSASAAST